MFFFRKTKSVTHLKPPRSCGINNARVPQIIQSSTVSSGVTAHGQPFLSLRSSYLGRFWLLRSLFCGRRYQQAKYSRTLYVAEFDFIFLRSHASLKLVPFFRSSTSHVHDVCSTTRMAHDVNGIRHTQSPSEFTPSGWLRRC